MLLVESIRDISRLVGAFARYSLQVQCSRRVWFRRLAEAKKIELAERIVALDDSSVVVTAGLDCLFGF